MYGCQENNVVSFLIHYGTKIGDTTKFKLRQDDHLKD